MKGRDTCGLSQLVAATSFYEIGASLIFDFNLISLAV